MLESGSSGSVGGEGGNLLAYPALCVNRCVFGIMDLRGSPEGTNHQGRQNPPRQESIGLGADQQRVG
jgi:hypothetical protein